MNQFSLRNNLLKFKTLRKLLSTVDESMEYTSQMNTEKPKDIDMEHVWFGNTRILTDYAQESPQTLPPKTDQST